MTFRALGGVRVERLFLLIAVPFGLAFVLVTGPFQAPDEFRHFCRAFQISEGTLVAQRIDTRLGGYLPESIAATGRYSSDLVYRPDRKHNLEDVQQALGIPLDSGRRVSFHFPNTALYSPVAYLPQVAGILAGRTLDLPPLAIAYVGRLTNLLAYVAIVFLAIRIVPFFKWVLACLALAPMSLFLAASLSADAFAIALVFLFLALVLDVVYGRPGAPPMRAGTMALLVAVSLLMTMTKSAYVVATLLVLLIPAAGFGSTARRALFVLVLVGVNAGGFLAWSNVAMAQLAGAALPRGIDPAAQMAFVTDRPLEYLEIVGRTFRLYGQRLLKEMIGVLGWLDTPLPSHVYYSFATVLGLLGLTGGSAHARVGAWQRIVLLAVVAAGTMLIFAGLYVNWTPVEFPRVQVLQGRYFIPLAPIALLLLYNRRLRLGGDMFSAALAAYLLYVLAVTAHSLWHRYYA